MKTLDEIKKMIESKLLANGFQKEPVFTNVPDCYFIPGKFSFELNTKYGWDYHDNPNGLLIEVQEVHRHNGTDQNASISIEVVNWHSNSGQRVLRDKIYNRNGDKKISQVIEGAIAVYNKN